MNFRRYELIYRHGINQSHLFAHFFHPLKKRCMSPVKDVKAADSVHLIYWIFEIMRQQWIKRDVRIHSRGINDLGLGLHISKSTILLMMFICFKLVLEIITSQCLYVWLYMRSIAEFLTAF